jgi:YegS/Rv2252/BmrU family lipid kinase
MERKMFFTIKKDKLKSFNYLCRLSRYKISPEAGTRSYERQTKQVNIKVKSIQKKAKSLRYLFILNPVAGVGERRDFLQMIAVACEEKKVEYKILFTRSPGDAKKIIRKKFDKFDVFVAVGGDGTMNEVASALAGTTGIMGLIPAGSGNALGRELGLSMKPVMAVHQLLNGHVTQIDTGMINGRRFMNVCGVGFDNHIAREFAKSTSRGPVPYFLAVWKEFFGYKPETYEVEIDGISTKFTAFVLTVANASQYGNKAFIAPKANISDGSLDICMLKPFGFFGALGLGFRLFNKSIDHSRHYIGSKAKKVLIKGNSLNFHVDGEPVKNQDPLEISIDPLSLNIVVP